MSQLKSWLQSQHASGLSLSMEEFSDGETKLPVHVAPESSVDQDLAEVAEAELKQDEIKRDCDVLVEGQTAMEAYMDLLAEASENGGISAQTASFMRVGLERYESLFGMDEGLTPANEAFGGTGSRQQATEVSLEAIKEVLDRGWEAVKAAFKALVNAMKDLYARITNAGGKLEKRANELKAKAKSMSGARQTQDKITISGAAKLFADGQWAGDDVAMMKGFLGESLERFPEAVVKYAMNAATEINKFKPENESADAAIKAILKLDGIVGALKTKSVTDGRFGKNVDVKRGEIMPGNMALYISEPTGSGDEIEQLSRLHSGLRADFLAVTDAKAGPKDYELPVESLDKLAARADQIAKCAQMLKNPKFDQKKVDTAVNTLIQSGDNLKKHMASVELTAEQKKRGDALLRGTVAIQRMLGGTINGLMSYSARTLNAQLVVIERQLAAYGAPKDAPRLAKD